METLWRTSLGKLAIGGCGTQLGLLFTCGGLTLFILFCSICVLTNVLTIGLAQESKQLLFGPPLTATPPGLPPEAVESLVGQVQLLHTEVQFLRSNVPVAAMPTATPTATPRPFLMATQEGINLRSGPGKDYQKIGVLPANATFEIVGRNSDASWWLVATRDGLFAWVSADLVSSTNLHSNIPVVTIPSLLSWGQPVNAAPAVIPAGSNQSTALPETGGPVPFVPTGTPTPGAEVTRTFVEDMPSYKRLTGQLLIPPVSVSISPDGKQIAVTERIKLYTVTTDGALSYIWLEENSERGPMGNLAWSPDGQFLAFDVGYKVKYCKPCRGVGVMRVADGAITYLEHPGDLDLSAPRWTTDGRLLVNAHPGEPASGTAYIYNTSGKGGLPASGPYVLSTSHEGQKWYPWLPGKTWLTGSTERADSYNAD
jgi:hypothetical protein